MKKVLAILFFGFALLSFFGWAWGFYFRNIDRLIVEALRPIEFLPEVVAVPASFLWNIAWMPHGPPYWYPEWIGFVVNFGILVLAFLMLRKASGSQKLKRG